MKSVVIGVRTIRCSSSVAVDDAMICMAMMLVVAGVMIAVASSSAHLLHSNVLWRIIVFPPAIPCSNTFHIVVLFHRSLAPRIIGPVDWFTEVDVVYCNASDQNSTSAKNAEKDDDWGWDCGGLGTRRHSILFDDDTHRRQVRSSSEEKRNI